MLHRRPALTAHRIALDPAALPAARSSPRQAGDTAGNRPRIGGWRNRPNAGSSEGLKVREWLLRPFAAGDECVRIALEEISQPLHGIGGVVQMLESARELLAHA